VAWNLQNAKEELVFENGRIVRRIFVWRIPSRNNHRSSPMKSPDPAKNTSGGANAGAGQQPEERIKEAGKQAVGDMARDASEEARSAVERGKHQAVGAAERTAAALDQTSANLAAEGQETLAEVAGMLSSRLSGLAHSLERRSLDELARDARQLAQRNPGLFVAGGVALGIALSRFFKASAPQRPSSADYGGYGSGSGYGSGYGSDGLDSGAYRSGAGSSSTGASPSGNGPCGSEAGIPPDARSSGKQSPGSSSTTGGVAGSRGTNAPTGGGND
jgi:hypothetical protein